MRFIVIIIITIIIKLLAVFSRDNSIGYESHFIKRKSQVRILLFLSLRGHVPKKKKKLLAMKSYPGTSGRKRKLLHNPSRIWRKDLKSLRKEKKKKKKVYGEYNRHPTFA
jgi:hypothetical protein